MTDSTSTDRARAGVRLRAPAHPARCAPVDPMAGSLARAALAAPLASNDPNPDPSVTTTLDTIAARLDGVTRRGGDAVVVDATHDSRQVDAGWLFCAVPGATADGHDHAPGAVASGASALLVERFVDVDVAQVRVPSVRAAMGPAAAAVHGDPSGALTVVGVTGTNGKTTTSYLLEGAFGAAAQGTGVIGTIATRIHGEPVPGVRTTPEGTDLQRLLATMRSRGVDAVAMEVSSHGLDMHRVDGTRFAVAVFTNLTQDHLDWHGTMEAYYRAKARLFTPSLAERGVVCVDDAWGRRLVTDAGIGVTTYGTHPSAEHRLVDVETGLDGGRATLKGPDGSVALSTRLLGTHNVANAAAAYLAAVAGGVDPEAARAGVAACPGVPGRLERVEAGQDFTVLVDYAHTPDAIEHIVATTRDLLPANGRLTVVVGAGGDRDRGKRPDMGAAAAGADRAVLTSDNPRSEDPQAILDEVVAGARKAVAGGAPAEVVVEVDRRAAIERAVAGAGPDDVIVIAGKGHETGQEFAAETIPFDDRVVAAEAIRGRRDPVGGAA